MSLRGAADGSVAQITCPHCSASHEASTTVCPWTGRPLAAAHATVPSSRSKPPPPPTPRSAVERRVSAPAPPPPPPRRSSPDAARRGSAALSADESAQAAARLLGTTVGGRYRVKGVLGEGGMGTVFEAEHLTLGRLVAIKVLHPAQAKRTVALQRFQNEARAAGTIGHPNICEVYDIGELPDGSPFLVMERLVGETLAERIAREKLDATDLVDIMLQVLSGLAAAHAKGVLHRDIKPENIFLNARIGVGPLAKLLDFGVAKEMNPQGDMVTDLTQAGMVMGTPFYLSPEQARGQRDLDGRTDLYACGVVMYEALAGARPFHGSTYNSLLRAIIFGEKKPLRSLRPDLPAGLDSVIESAMAVDRAERYRDCVALQEALMPYHAASYISSRSLPNPSSSPSLVGSGTPSGTASSLGQWDETLYDPALGARVVAAARADQDAAVPSSVPQTSPSPRPSSSPDAAPSLDDLDYDEITVRSTKSSELARVIRKESPRPYTKKG